MFLINVKLILVLSIAIKAKCSSRCLVKMENNETTRNGNADELLKNEYESYCKRAKMNKEPEKGTIRPQPYTSGVQTESPKNSTTITSIFIK